MQARGNRHIPRRRAATDALDEVNEELSWATWEVDFLTRAASEQAPAPTGSTPDRGAEQPAPGRGFQIWGLGLWR